MYVAMLMGGVTQANLTSSLVTSGRGNKLVTTVTGLTAAPVHQYGSSQPGFMQSSTRQHAR